MSLEDDLTALLRATCEATREHGYVDTELLQMLGEVGGLAAAKRLLAKWTHHEGLYRLLDLRLLHESLEAVVWDNPRFHPLFTESELGIAWRRLDELGYFEK